MRRIFIFSFFIFHFSFLIALEPVFVSELPNPNEYELFANNGWDGNWYVGYDHAWILKLDLSSVKGNFKKAFIGAKLGRAKTKKQIEKLLKQMISQKESEIEKMEKKDERKRASEELEKLKQKQKYVDEINFYIAISEDEDFSNDRKYLLARNSEIPLEGDMTEAINFVGESQWFWVEVPISEISFKGQNYIAIWSDNPLLTSTAFAPILAAGWTEKKANIRFLTTDNKGKAPKTCEKKISFFSPALAMKLVPENTERVFVKIRNFQVEKNVLRVFPEVKGRLITRVFLKVYHGKKQVPSGFGEVTPPYFLTVRDLKEGRYSFTVVAENWWGNTDESEKINFEIK